MMATDLNLCQFIGRLGADPDTRFTASGSAVTKLRIACGRAWKDKDGNKHEETEWVRVTAFGKLAEIIREYCRKGGQVYIAGRLHTSTYDKDGETRYSTEIIAEQMQMLGSRDGSAQGRAPVKDCPQPDQGNASEFVDDETIPF